jgi:hypothetical protein
MNLKLFTFLLTVFLVNLCYSQNEEDEENRYEYDYKKVVVYKTHFSIYYGMPSYDKIIANVAGNIVLTELGNEGYNDISKKVTGINPIGIRASHRFFDNIEVGADLFFVRTKLRFQFEEYSNNMNEMYYVDLISNRVNIFFFADLMLKGNTEIFQQSFGLSGGFNFSNFKFKTNAEDENNEINDLMENVFRRNLRVAYNMRYFFSPNLGMNASIGIGGPLFSFGFSYRM